jgi:hypothetical protein
MCRYDSWSGVEEMMRLELRIHIWVPVPVECPLVVTISARLDFFYFLVFAK